MKKYYSFKIPEPCHEDWNSMTPTTKGRFCSSCDKTVIDFTNMSRYEIGSYLKEHQASGVCGHIYTSQLDQIVLRIPAHLLEQQRFSSKFFALALLIVMGTTLLSCTNSSGTKQKIDAVELIESMEQDTITKTVCAQVPVQPADTLPEKIPPVVEKITPPPPIPTTGLMIQVEGEMFLDTDQDQLYPEDDPDHLP
jgi:hypothetical protein